MRIKVNKYRFETWKLDKLDKSAIDGKKVELYKIRMSKVRKNTPPVLDGKDKLIVEFIINEVNKNKYIVEKDIKIDKVSKAKVQRTIKDKKLMNKFNLKRVRASKIIKGKLGIYISNYPFIICKRER